MSTDAAQLFAAARTEWRLARVDEVPIWSLSCFYIRIGYRKRGITAALNAAGG